MKKKILILITALFSILLVSAIILYHKSVKNDHFDFYRKYNDSLSLHVVGEIRDVGIDFVFDRNVTVIRNDRDSVIFRAEISERIGFYIKYDTAEAGEILLLFKNIDNPYCAVVNMNQLKVMQMSDMKEDDYDSSQLFLDRYSVELGGDLP